MTNPNLVGLIERLASDILKLPRRIQPIGEQYCTYVTLGDVLDLVEQTKQRAALRTVSDEPGAGENERAMDIIRRAAAHIAKTYPDLVAPDPAIPADTQSREGEKP